MSTTIPNMQVLVNAVKVEPTSIEVQREYGKVRVDTIDGLILYSETAKSITITVEAPALPDGIQVDDWKFGVEGTDAEVMVFVAGGKSWKGAGVFLNGGVSQSAGAGQSQQFVIECPLTRFAK